MLMSSMFTILSTTSRPMKSSWESMIIMTVMMNLLLIMMNPIMNNAQYFIYSNYSIDSMSMLMFSLSMWISSLMMLASYKLKNTKNNNMFKTSIIVLLVSLMMCFSTNNLLIFYVMFEFSLIPILLMIMMWGYQPERVTASLYIMVYTITASLPLLVIIMKFSNSNSHMNFMLYNNYFSTMPLYMNQSTMWIMLMLAFLVKLPLFSMHMWLPKAHVEAPVAGSMILAAVLLKLGGYGFMRMNKLIMNTVQIIPFTIMIIAVIGAMITNILCFRQTDLKALIAYSSVGHMGLLVISNLSNSKLGQYGSLMIMITHGLSSSCMFLLTNIMYEKLNTRNIMLTNSSPSINPSNSLMWTIIIFVNMAIPPSLNILSEIIIMMSSFFIMKLLIIPLMICSLTSASYSTFLYSMINHGNSLKFTNSSMQMKSIEMTATISHLWPLFIMTTIPMKMMM